MSTNPQNLDLPPSTTDTSAYTTEGAISAMKPIDAFAASQPVVAQASSTGGGQLSTYTPQALYTAEYELPSSDFLEFSFRLVNPLSGSVISYNGNPLVLTFHVNPQSFDRAYKKLTAREQTRGGWVEYYGGDDLDVINVNGISSAFISLDSYGLVNIAQGRAKTIARQEIDVLLDLFRNNANAYDSRGFIYKSGSVLLEYDRNIYAGKFETLTMTESAEKPYSLDYGFSFVVTETLYTHAGSFGNQIDSVNITGTGKV